MKKSLLALSLLTAFGSASADTIVADSVADFSGTQGQNSWYYGYKNGNLASYSLTSFTQFSYFVDGVAWKYIKDGGAPWTQLWADGGHPNGPNSGTAQVAVRRWISEIDGKVSIAGVLADTHPCCDNGVRGAIFIDGIDVWSASIADGGSTNFSFGASVARGSRVDFVLDPNGTDSADSTRFSARITSAVPEPETYAMLLAGLGLMGGIARRRKQA